MKELKKKCRSVNHYLRVFGLYYESFPKGIVHWVMVERTFAK